MGHYTDVAACIYGKNVGGPDDDEPRKLLRGSSGVHTCANSLQPGIRSPLRCHDNECETPPSESIETPRVIIEEFIVLEITSRIG